MLDKTTEKIYYDPISVAQRTKQKLYLVDSRDKSEILHYFIKNNEDVHAVVITKTKREADALNVYLNSQKINTVSVHGSKRADQNINDVIAFEETKVSILITTDMILQSLKLSNITHLISYDLPSEPEHYLSRMVCLKEQGEAVAFVSEEDAVALLDIERVMRQEILEEEIVGFIPTPVQEARSQPVKEKKKKPRHRKQKRKVQSDNNS